jgi:hypothetical protein
LIAWGPFMKSKKIFWENWIILFGGLSVLVTAFLLDPDPRGFGTHEHLHLPPCFFLWLTHVPCPSCGLTTSFAYLAKGHLLMAFQVHPMGPVLFAGLLFLIGDALWSVIRHRSFWALLENPASLWVGGVLLGGLFVTWMTRILMHERLAFAIRSF